MSEETFERFITISAAFDRRHSEPSKDYGIHGCELRMVLKGSLGATQFLLYTNWQLPHVTRMELEYFSRPANWDPLGFKSRFLPLPADKGYHWLTPRYEGQSARGCDLLVGGRCFYDGSGLNADDMYQTLLKEGSEGVWRELEQYYRALKEAPYGE